jgi:hypothetical protein
MMAMLMDGLPVGNSESSSGEMSSTEYRVRKWYLRIDAEEFLTPRTAGYLVTLISVLYFQLFTAFKCPSSVLHKVFSLRTDRHGRLLAFLTVTQTRPMIHFLVVTAAVFRDMASESSASLIARYQFIPSSLHSEKRVDVTEAHELAFQEGNPLSAVAQIGPFCLSAVHFHTISVEFECNTTAIERGLFSWYSDDFRAKAFLWSDRSLAVLFVSHSFLHFDISCRFDLHPSIRIAIIVIGVAAFLATSPITCYFPDIWQARILDTLFQTLFFALYKVFLIVALDMLRFNTTSPDRALLVRLSIIFAAYAVIDFAASYQAALDFAAPYCGILLPPASCAARPVGLIVAEIRAIADCLYAGYSLLFLATAIMSEGRSGTSKLLLFGSSVARTVVALLVTHVWPLFVDHWEYHSVPIIVNGSVMAMLTAATFFLFTCMDEETGLECQEVGNESLTGNDTLSEVEWSSRPSGE